MLSFIAVSLGVVSIGVLVTSMLLSIIGVEIMSAVDFDSLSK